jgi:NADH-quinone oxidoreductase subunit J
MNADLILFFFLAVVAVAAAVAMILSRNAVYSSLFLVFNFSIIALFYLLLTGPFIAMAQISVYAGAIMVLFLFVIMLLGVVRDTPPQKVPWQRPVAYILGLALLLETGYVLIFHRSDLTFSEAPQLASGFGAPAAIAEDLFLQYALPVQIVGVILLVAIVGVIVMTKVDKRKA